MRQPLKTFQTVFSLVWFNMILEQYIQSAVLPGKTADPMNRRSVFMWKKIIAAVAVIGILCAILIPRFTKKEQYAKPVALPVVSIAQPKTGETIRLTTSVVGTIEPSDVVYIYPKTAGDVTEVNVKAGDVVTAGTVLCAIDTKQVDTAKNTMDAAAVNLRQAKEELQRQQILYNGGGLSEQEYARFKNSAESAEIQYNTAKFNYETQLEYSQITAPIDGLVEICDVETYKHVSSNQMLFVLSGQGSRVCSFNTTERICGYLFEGDEIDVEKDGKTYKGRICEISTMADESSGLYKVKASIEEGARLSTGSRVKLTVTSRKTENAMTVPVDAVYYDDSEPYVFVYREGKIYRTDLETGIYDSTRMEVLSGLKADDQVVTSWSSELYDDSAVRLPGEDTGGGSQGGGGQGGQGGPGGGRPR